ncbi:MAG: tyrosinase family protein [Acidobacteria bacterium]|nr:tyrosinase family protein [Acidobacteriota bacterium]
MQAEIQINNSTTPAARYLTWAPSPCRVRITNPAGSPAVQLRVRLGTRTNTGGGSVAFAAQAGGPYASTLTVTVPVNGQSVSFFVRGVFGKPSSGDRDVIIEARARSAPSSGNWRLLGTLPVMVRIRKNANNLTSGERTRLVAAFAQLNDQGLGRFADFREMHVNQSSPEAHGRPAFLPWHRAYLLDLERELQAVDPSVALPYWRFDQPAPSLFTPDYLGVSDALGNVQLSATNPLQFWRTDNVPGIVRRPFFDPGQAPAGLRTEAQTLALGAQYTGFRTLEGNPHGSAHTSFGGFISSIGTAARDPLFFLLHCNVDRLWAKWQLQNNRFDSGVAASYDTNNPGNKTGHNLVDTMWPWNGITTGDRPPFAPGGALASSACVNAPGPQPRVQDCFDYRGSVAAVAQMGFDYDDVG